MGKREKNQVEGCNAHVAAVGQKRKRKAKKERRKVSSRNRAEGGQTVGR